MQVITAARDNDAGGRDGVLTPLVSTLAGVKPQPAFARDVTAAIDDQNYVMDSASVRLSGCRVRVKALTSRLASLLKV